MAADIQLGALKSANAAAGAAATATLFLSPAPFTALLPFLILRVSLSL